MEAIIIIPGLAAGYLVIRHSVERAFLDVYVPVLILLPEYYRLVLPGVPDPTFSMAAIVPVAWGFLAGREWGWRWGVTDVLVGLYAVWVIGTEWLNAGYGEAQNLGVDTLLWVVMPYMLGKGVIEPGGMRIRLARRLVWLMALVSLVSVYELRMGANLWRMLLDWSFPGQGLEWVTTFRWGLARISGPYGHAILAGVLLVCGYQLQRWLARTGGWELKFSRMAWLPGRKSGWITALLLSGVVMSIARGPWVGALAAALVVRFGRSRDRRTAIQVILTTVLVAAIPLTPLAYSYVSVGRANALTVAQESATYRKELVDKYVDVAIERGFVGWGRNTWPRVGGLGSIDNHFLLLALMHGVMALLLLLAILARTILRLLRQGMREAPGEGFSFVLLGIFCAVVTSLLTVYMGNQLVPFFFLMIGWSEGYLQLFAQKQEQRYRLNFRRILA